MADGTSPADHASDSQRARRRFGAGVVGVAISAAVLGTAATAHADGDDSRGTRQGTRTGNSESSSAPRPNSPSSRPAASGRSRPVVTPQARTANGGVETVTIELPRVAAAVTSPAATDPVRKVADSAVPAPTAVKTARAQPGPVMAVFISDGTAQHPDAGLLIGNGYTFTKVEGACSQGAACDGGRAGSLFGNGGGGFNGGNGANAGFFAGSGGKGGAGVTGIKGGNGGNGGSAGLFGNGGDGGTADRFSVGAVGGNGGAAGLFDSKGGDGGGSATGGNGGTGGKGGLLFGYGGRGGIGGPGTMTCAAPTCTVVITPGLGGEGGIGGVFGGAAGRAGFAAAPRDSLLLLGYNPVYPVGTQIDQNGRGVEYPSQTDPSKPYAIPGTVVPDVEPHLPEGTVLTRFGFGGGYLAPTDTRFAQLSLPPLSSVQPYFEYVINDPTKFPANWSIEQSQVAPWFGQPGGGVQFRIIDDQGNSDGTIPRLVALQYLAFR